MIELGHQYEGQLEEIGNEFGETLDKIQPQCIDRTDLEQVAFYFASCFECKRGTVPNSTWFIAGGDAMDIGFRKVGTKVYCKACIPVALQKEANNG